MDRLKPPEIYSNLVSVIIDVIKASIFHKASKTRFDSRLIAVSLVDQVAVGERLLKGQKDSVNEESGRCGQVAVGVSDR